MKSNITPVSKRFAEYLKEKGIYDEFVKATNEYRTNLKPRLSFRMRMRLADRGDIKPNDIMLWCFDTSVPKIDQNYAKLAQGWERHLQAGMRLKLKRTK